MCKWQSAPILERHRKQGQSKAGLKRGFVAELAIREVEGAVVFKVKVVAGSSQTGICGLLDGTLKVKVAAAPEKGKANQCLAGFLAKRLGVKKNAVSIISGRTNPVKNVQVLGISVEEVLTKLEVK